MSDPWYLATYFLPLLLTTLYFCWKKVINKTLLIILSVSFIISVTHLIPKALHLPIQKFKLATPEQWLINSEWSVSILGKSLNIFFIDSSIAYTLSFAVWSLLIIYSIKKLINKCDAVRFVALFSFLTISAIFSSFILSYTAPEDISARFFPNAICFSVALFVLFISLSGKKSFSVLLIIYITSSIYSYQNIATPLHNEETRTREFIAFLKKNNLSFGYGDYWNLSNNVNWLSFGEIHISPVMFGSDNKIIFNKSRAQTMKSWLSQLYIDNSPERQFIAIPETEGQNDLKLKAIRNQIGSPDEKLVFQNLTIFVYQHKIPLM